MTDAKQRAAAALTRASQELDRALREVDQIQTYDPALVGHVAHALGNYISVTAATVEMLRLNLRDYPDADVRNWVDGIGHAADLMMHSVNRLVSHSSPRDFPLKLERVNLALLMDRACEYFRHKPGAEHVPIACSALDAVPLAWGDRVAMAVVADNMLGQRPSRRPGPWRQHSRAADGRARVHRLLGDAAGSGPHPGTAGQGLRRVRPVGGRRIHPPYGRRFMVRQRKWARNGVLVPASRARVAALHCNRRLGAEPWRNRESS